MRFLALACLLLLAACNSEKVELAFGTSQEDETYLVSAVMDATVELDSGSTAKPESMHTSLFLSSKFSMLAAYDDGSSRYQVEIDSVSYTSDKRSMEELAYMERSIKTQGFQYKIASDGEIMSMPAAENFVPVLGAYDLDVAKLFVKLQPVLPGKPVAVGESWERQHAASESDKQTIIYKTFTLEDVFYRGASKIAKIELGVRYKQNDEDSVMKLESKDFLVGRGTLLFDVSLGRIEEISVEITGNLTIHEKAGSKTYPDFNVRQKLKMKRGEA